VKALVVGFGSIGQRHARLLDTLGCSVAVVSRREVDFPRRYPDISVALSEFHPDYVVLAGRTAEHHDDLTALVEGDFAGRVLIEKPLFECLREPSPHRFSHVAVAYNLRFHPLMLRLHEYLADQSRLVAAHAYVGQYLPQWRPDTDYRNSYSARRSEGGGVLRDLSHELDYAHWLFGPWTRLTAMGGHHSELEIDSEDVFSIMLETRRCPVVTLQLNYLDRKPRREILIHTDSHSVRLDLIDGIFEIDGELKETAKPDRDHTYLAEHRAMIAGDMAAMASLDDGIEAMRMIDAAERAAQTCVWVAR